MTATVCAWCRTHSNMTPVSGPKFKPGPDRPGQATRTVQGAFVCNHCYKLSVATGELSQRTSIPLVVPETWWDFPLRWTPEQVGGRDFPDVPAHIASAADEAFRCRSIESLRAAILMARSAIEATCKDHGVTKGQLAAKIDEMAAKGLIRSFTQDAAHELRHLGNDMAHGDFVDAVDTDDAESVLEVMAEILNEVYQGPARVGRMKAKREGAPPAGLAALAGTSSSSGPDLFGNGSDH
jgi:hypothetical protein